MSETKQNNQTEQNIDLSKFKPADESLIERSNHSGFGRYTGKIFDAFIDFTCDNLPAIEDVLKSAVSTTHHR